MRFAAPLTIPAGSDRVILLDRESPARPLAAAVFLCPPGGGAVSKRRHGGPPRKDGPRKADGRLKYEPGIDQGHDATLERRACLVGSADARDPRAGYPLGVLLLRGLLADPDMAGDAAKDQARERHDAGLRYAADHAIVFGPRTPKSHLAAIIDGIRHRAASDGRPESKIALDAGERYGRKVAAVRLLPPPSNPFPHHVLDRIAIEEKFSLTQPDLEALRRALDALIDIR